MAKTSPALDTPLGDRLERLAAYEPQQAPVVSLYLNLTPDQHGRDNYEAFVRKAFAERAKAFKEQSAERASIERDAERITKYLVTDVDPSVNGLAVFASSGAGEFFEAIQLDAPIADHWLFVGSVPHLYPLAKIIDQYPRYASVVLDRNRARISVFELGRLERHEQVTGEKTNRTSMGGWSQARYQRRNENAHVSHVKEVIETLERIVTADNIAHIIAAGDDGVVSLFKEQLPKHLLEKLVDVVSLPRDAAEHDILEATFAVLRKRDADTDAERVQDLVDEWKSGGLGVMGPDSTLKALQMGQVDELLITGSPQQLGGAKLPADAAPGPVSVETSAAGDTDQRQLKLADELVTRAQQTGATVRFIEDESLLDAFGGVGALLRFRI